MTRVVSLLPSATEIICSLGLENFLIGRSHECDYPAIVRRLPVVTSPRYSSDGPSREINENVSQAMAKGETLYRVDGKMLSQLNPDVVITQATCDVCAVSKESLENDLKEYPSLRPEIVTLHVNSIPDLWTSISQVASSLNVLERGDELILRLKKRMEIIRNRTGVNGRPKVIAIEWLDPLMVAGNWVPELIELAGGDPLLGNSGKASHWITWENVRRANPDFLLIMPCGFDCDRTRSEMNLLSHQPGWHELNAVVNNRVVLIDGNAYFNRPGPRLLDSAEILAEILHGDPFDYGHRIGAWEYFGPGF